ncbi:MAG TPA: hypothetical protein VMZ28_22920 [Kofleriaceae bacterium]|nr:hypothetical protein [Kofleriaceae bacterium]
MRALALALATAAACNSGSDPAGSDAGGSGGGDGGAAEDPDGGGGSTCAATGWVADTVKSEDSVGWGSRVALDDDGSVHITYANATHSALEHAILPPGGAWVFETADEDASNGVLEEVAQLVAGGTVHASYVGTDDEGEKRLKHAVRLGDDDWDTELVDLERRVGTATAIAMDGAGVLHIAYRDDDDEVVRHAWWTGDGWDSELVDEGPWTGIYLNIAIDGDDTLHLAYYDSTRSALRHAMRPAGGTWTAVTAAEEGNPGHRAALAVGADGSVHIASMAVAGGEDDLVYTHRAPGGEWTTVTVDAAGKAGYQSIALDGGGGVHIAYRDEADGALEYAYRAPGGDEWQLEPVDEEGDVGLFPSIVVAADGVATISYVDRSPDGGGFAEDLKVARSAGCE